MTHAVTEPFYFLNAFLTTLRTSMGQFSPRSLAQRLESLAQAGVTHLPKRSTHHKKTDSSTQKMNMRNVVASTQNNDRVDTLRVLRQSIEECTLCEELADTRTKTVFGSGSPNARLCFIGEAPGADEDASGEPFVGRAGQLLTKIIEACTLTRDEVYILNVLKCRPPGNRTPHPREVSNCRPYFEKQMSIIQPEFICCLGASAAHALLQINAPIGKLRRRWFTFEQAQVLCTYHPSYLLRNPAAKRDVWDDMKLLMAEMGIQVQKKT